MQLDVTTLIHPCMYGECLRIMREPGFYTVVSVLAQRLDTHLTRGPTLIGMSDIWLDGGIMDLLYQYRGRRLEDSRHFKEQLGRAVSSIFGTLPTMVMIIANANQLPLRDVMEYNAMAGDQVFVIVPNYM
jgi:hypothetical protein